MIRLQVAPSTGKEHDEFSDIYEGSENEFLLNQLRPYTTYMYVLHATRKKVDINVFHHRSFRVLAINSIGEGVWSQPVSLTTDKGKGFVRPLQTPLVIYTAYVQGIPSKPSPLELLRKSITSLTLGVHPCQSDGGEVTKHAFPNLPFLNSCFEQAIKAYRIFLARVPDELNLAEGVIRTTTDLTLKFEEVSAQSSVLVLS